MKDRKNMTNEEVIAHNVAVTKKLDHPDDRRAMIAGAIKKQPHKRALWEEVLRRALS